MNGAPNASMRAFLHNDVGLSGSDLESWEFIARGLAMNCAKKSDPDASPSRGWLDGARAVCVNKQGFMEKPQVKTTQLDDAKGRFGEVSLGNGISYTHISGGFRTSAAMQLEGENAAALCAMPNEELAECWEQEMSFHPELNVEQTKKDNAEWGFAEEMNERRKLL